MFKHKGKKRTHLHNLRLASILSFTAGIVNITGVIAVKVLTTNVTGHFAFFADGLVSKNYTLAILSLLFILFFLLGSFVSNLMVEITALKYPAIAYTFPLFTEIILLTLTAFKDSLAVLRGIDNNAVACVLLFTMGMQNALVTKVSQSAVRTTHLTGLFTDLGIELSQLFVYRKTGEIKTLLRSIYLKLAIICFFFIGCIAGGFLFTLYALKTLLLAAGCIVIALLYDNILYRFYSIKRKMQSA